MMDPSTYKRYHVHGWDSRQYLEDYFSDKPNMPFEEDALQFPIKSLRKAFSKGHIRGDVLIDLSNGSFVHHLYAACEFFKNIIVLKATERCIMELKRWLDTRTGAFYWGNAIKMHGDIEGNCDPFQDKEQKVRSAIPHVMKCDLDKEDITGPIVLPPADCIISAWLLDVISKDPDDYRRYVRKFSGMLKPGGHLIIIGTLNATFMIVGRDKLHVLSCEEDFVRKALVEAGFAIDNFVVKKRTAVSDLIDYNNMIFIEAHKEK